MLNEMIVQLLGDSSPKDLKNLMRSIQKQRKKKNISNLKIFRKFLQFFKIQNEMMFLLFGFSSNDYQTKILSVACDLCNWYIEKAKKKSFPKISLDKEVSTIFTEFNKTQEEEENKWNDFHLFHNDDEEERKENVGMKQQKSKEEIMKEIEEQNE
jgi:hypothetical protein